MSENIKEVRFEKTIEYIKLLLTYSKNELANRILYVDEADLLSICNASTGKILIVSSDFFKDNIYGTAKSEKLISCVKMDDLIVLIGKNKRKEINGNIVLFADFIASSYYILSRYEEYIKPNIRDMYGNYPVRESILYKNNLLEMPIIDMYSQYVLDIFSELDNRKYEIEKGFKSISFTHDIDVPFERYSFVRMCKMIGKTLIVNHRLVIYPLLNWLGIYRINPRATWDYMLKQEHKVKNIVDVDTKSICFIVALKRSDEYTMDYIEDKKTYKYLDEMKKYGAIIGLHTSYCGAESEEQVRCEKRELEETIMEKVFCQRNHYLRQISPLDIKRYEEVGFTDDYTTGFNEMPGFRLGTSRVVKWINPESGKLHDIQIHGLHIMDGSLDGSKPYQLELNYAEAKALCKKIIDQVYEYGGDLCVLWHNGMFNKSQENYQKDIYDWIIDYCVELLRG